MADLLGEHNIIIIMLHIKQLFFLKGGKFFIVIDSRTVNQEKREILGCGVKTKERKETPINYLKSIISIA